MPQRPARFRRGLIEMVVVAVGVFGGLAADEWRVSRFAAAQASQYLERVESDLRLDSRFLASQLSDLEAKLPVLDRLTRLTHVADATQAEALALDLTTALRWAWAGIPLRRHTMDEMVSSSDLDLLPLELREELTTFYTAAAVWEGNLLRRRADSGLGQLTVRYVRVERGADGSEVLLPLTAMEIDALQNSLSLEQLRREATAEWNHSWEARRVVGILLGQVERLLSLLGDGV